MKDQLFSLPGSFALDAIGLLEQAADAAMPMTAAQRRDLPHACRDLSAMLTTERGSISRPYWASPRLTSAYLRYFLPWNIVRMASLLPSLDLGDPPGSPLILDLGSGPFTLPMALWMSRPDLRALPVTIVASDTSPHVMELGRTMFSFLRAKLDPESPWTVRTMRSAAAQALRRLRAKPGGLWLLCMANVLNEMDERRPRPGQHISERLRLLLEDACAMLAEDGRVLAIEPGTRQGGRLTALLRRSALGGGCDGDDEDIASPAAREEMFGRSAEDDGIEDDGGFGSDLPPLFHPLSPCLHAGACPMLERGVSAWCHFNAPAPHAPGFLRDLSARAGMDKGSVSLSFLLLQKQDREEPMRSPRMRGAIPARVVSDAFSVPGLSGAARYACTPRGLALVPDALRLSQGEACLVRPTHERDAKSRAAIMLPEGGEGPARTPEKRRGQVRPGGKRGEEAPGRRRKGGAGGTRHPSPKSAQNKRTR